MDQKKFRYVYKDGEEFHSLSNIRILTYNVFMRPPPVTSNSSDYKEERLKDFINYKMNSFDVICVQELFGLFNDRKNKFIKAAKSKGLENYHRTDPLSFFSRYLVDSGLVTVSRFPIVAKEFEPFDNTILIDSIARKGVMYSKIKIEDNFLHMLTTHTQASHYGFQGAEFQRVSTKYNKFR